MTVVFKPWVAKRTKSDRRRNAAVLACGTALSCALLLSCASGGRYLWYRNLPKTDWGGPSGEYVISVGDGIRVQVYENEPLTTTAKIRTDGRIALPFVGEIVAAGKHPSALAREIEARLKEFIVSPRVTVNVEEAQPVVVSVLGEVAHVGSLTLQPSSGLLEALAQAGGPSEYADKSSIFVLRRSPEFRRIRFTYDALVQNDDGAATFPLLTGDVIVVE
jgi:polysaccharide export outer membrane protein